MKKLVGRNINSGYKKKNNTKLWLEYKNSTVCIKKIHIVLHETATKSIGKYNIPNNILNSWRSKKVKTNSIK